MPEPEVVLRLVRATFGGMTGGPRNLDRTLHFYAQEEGIEFSSAELCEFLSQAHVNDPVALHLLQTLPRWDAAHEEPWMQDTAPNTVERRALIYELLDATPEFRALCDERFPFYDESEPVITISRQFERWYTPERRATSHFFWNAYSGYLRQRNNWSGASIGVLDRSTTEIVERLADPTRPDIYQSRGLVVGYVQSGKTANFTGVIAKAADAGYRLIIVLAGTMNLLRAQTQRRIDRELIGKELLESEYVDDDGWATFLEHGSRPSRLGAFDWERLTGKGGDYQSLHRGIQALDFPQFDRTRPFYDPVNLSRANAKIIVVKKAPQILRKLARDLGRITARLQDIPTLVIDDESDQASPDTTRPPTDSAEARRRTATNRAIVELLGQLPRAQYVGYTATPFANVFIDPTDAEDLFPRDYIVALPRPTGYMGAANFHDLTLPPPEGYESNERALVRSVRNEDAAADSLPRALDSFILTGAIKLYREQHDPSWAPRFRHHTMLVHVSVRNDNQEDIAREVRTILEGRDYDAGRGYLELERLWNEDFSPVGAVRNREGYPMPETFEDLRPFIGACITKVFDGRRDPVLVVNERHEEDNPDFDREQVWKILVGGAKLSRGYTVEGLTISYYRRRTQAADTLMQMGRWFGFRYGYEDLVRLFIGRSEPFGARRTIDLYAAFEGVCRDEIEFRQELRRYAMPGEGEPITPAQVPPLVPAHLLRPTSTNKMYNAVIHSRNFGGDWSEKTGAAAAPEDMTFNLQATADLLSQGIPSETAFRFSDGNGAVVNFLAHVVAVTPEQLLGFLRQYRWQRNSSSVGGASALHYEIDFLEGRHGNPEISRWLVIAPQITTTQNPWQLADGREFSVFERSRIHSGGRFKVYSEPRHRTVAALLAGKTTTASLLSPDADGLQQEHQGVMLLYPIRDNNGHDEDRITIGLGLQFPPNNIATPISFSVRDPNHEDAVVVEIAAG